MQTISPINKERLSGQNKRLFDYLNTGKTIHCFDPAKSELRIGYLNSRCSDLKNLHHIEIHKRTIQVEVKGEKVTVVEYSLNPFKPAA